MPNENTPARPQRETVFPNYLALGLFLGMAIGFGRAFTGSHSVNDSLVSAAWIIGIATILPIAFNLLGKKPLKRLFASLFSCLYGAVMISGMLVAISGGVVERWYSATPVMAEFAQKDFDRIDSAHTGVITYSQLNEIVTAQDGLIMELAWVDRHEKEVDAMLIDDASKVKIKAAYEEARTWMRGQQIPADQLQRIRVVKFNLYPVGHPIPPATAQSTVDAWGISRDELITAPAKLERDFHVWTVILRKLGFI